MLVANIDGTIVALASDQRAAALLVVKDCALVPAQNAQGSTYYFDLGALKERSYGWSSIS